MELGVAGKRAKNKGYYKTLSGNPHARTILYDDAGLARGRPFVRKKIYYRISKGAINPFYPNSFPHDYEKPFSRSTHDDAGCP